MFYQSSGVQQQKISRTQNLPLDHVYEFVEMRELLVSLHDCAVVVDNVGFMSGRVS